MCAYRYMYTCTYKYIEIYRNGQFVCVAICLCAPNYFQRYFLPDQLRADSVRKSAHTLQKASQLIYDEEGRRKQNNRP
jgi:hypothetical protein